MNKVLSYRDLDAWKVGMAVAEQTYALSAIERVRQLLYGIRRPEQRRLLLPGGSLLLFVLPGSVSVW